MKKYIETRQEQLREDRDKNSTMNMTNSGTID